MKKMRFLSLLLALVMMLGVMPMAVFATEDGELDGGETTVETPTFTAEDYNALYVDGGDLVFAWDAFDITADFNGTMVSWVDGMELPFTSTYAWTNFDIGGVACNTYGEQIKAFIPWALAPQDEA